MKRKWIIIFLIISFLMETLCIYLGLGKLSDTKQDSVKVNECVKSVEMNYGNSDRYCRALDYVVTDGEGAVVFRTKEGLPDTENEAIVNQCLILDFTAEGTNGKIIFENTLGDRLSAYKTHLRAAVFCIMVLQFVVIAVWLIYIERKVIKPFRKLNDFAVRVASGNLDVPLEMDTGHIFGEFTEAFDLMRSELKKAREAERKANEEKKEIIAKLSHDIKTPIASIKSTSEIGLVTVKDDRAREMFGQINTKTDQIKTLVDNLFNSSVKELTEISVNPVKSESSVIKELIRNADYLSRAKEFEIPDTCVYIDRLRLQQAFDNIFLNSYKYADTVISVSAKVEGDYFSVKISDTGSGVTEDELPLLKEKYRRGAGSGNRDGAGLGLYLTNYYVEEMGGFLEIQNENPGLGVTIHLRLI